MLLRWTLIIAGWLPLPLLHALGALAGVLLWIVPSKPKRRTLLHLRLAFPEKSETERNRIARASLRHLGMTVMEAPAIWFGPERRLRGWLRDKDSQAALAQICAQGAAIMLCPHIGSWELAGMFCAAAGPITSLYKPQKGVVDALIQRGRARLGAKLASSDGPGGVRALIRALRDGEMIGVLPDQDPPEGSGEFAPLFGVAAHTPTLVTRLAGRTHAPVWFCYAQRLSWGRGFSLHLKPLPVDVGDEKTGVAALNREVETVLCEMPEQYWWNYPRYRRRPPGEPPLY